MGEALDILDSCTDDELQFLVDIILQKGDLTESLKMNTKEIKTIQLNM